MANKQTTAKYWSEQALLALDYAHARPAADLKGFLSAVRDAAEFQRLASLAGSAP